MVADCNTTWNLMPIITSAWESLSPTNVQLDESGGRHRRRRIVGGGRTYLCNWRSQCYFVLDFLEQWQRWWWTDRCMPAWDGRREETAKPSRWLFIDAVCVLGQLLRGRGAVKETATACRGEGEMRMDVRIMNDMEQLRKSRNRSSLKMIWNKWGNVESQNRFDLETI